VSGYSVDGHHHDIAAVRAAEDAELAALPTARLIRYCAES
jgi:hypothetical protein